MVGKSLGPYDILEPIGAGGMGEVYLAMDTRLRRKVAIKVLPGDYAADPERLARFTLEARASAALNHNNIAAVYDVGEADGTHFMVQEYLQGETLQHALAGGALPLKRALRLGSEIAAALAAAHEAGIVHRDLKPANVFVVKGDHAKVLDFGLAKFIQAEGDDGGDLGATATAFGTAAGVIMGSPGYMAPEQIRGAEIDQRTDVFAFGCVLYELASGMRAFGGETAVEVLNGILKEEPTPLAVIDPILPMDLVRIVSKCLAKDPARRYQNSNDLVVDLAVLSDAVSSDSALSIGSFIQAEAKERPKVRTGRHPLWWPAVAGLFLLAAAVVGYAGRNFVAKDIAVAPAPVTFPPINLPAEQELTQAGWTLPLAMSPDGTRLVYTGGTPSQLYLRDFNAGDARPIPGTENGDAPFFSPDGEWVGFFADDLARLKRVRITTGEIRDICECRFDGGGYPIWRPDDVIVWTAMSFGLAIVGVQAAGGTPIPLTAAELEPSLGGDAAPEDSNAAMILPAVLALLPDGETLLGLILSNAPGDPAFLAVASSAGGGWRRLTAPGFLGDDITGPLQYVPSGHLVYGTVAGLVAVPFDAVGLEVMGRPTVVIPAAELEIPLSFGSPAFFAAAANGSLVWASPRPASAQNSLVWVDHQGATTVLRASRGDYSIPRFSPDGNRVAVNSGAYEWLIDLERDTETRLSEGKSANQGSPVWTPDGSQIVIGRGFPSPDRIAWMSAENTGMERSRLKGMEPLFPTAWAPRGELAITRYEQGDYDILLMAPSGDREPVAPTPLIATADLEGSATFSPDGDWVAYTSGESGAPEVYVQPYPGPGRRWTISGAGGTSPVWAPDGRTLYYREGRRMMAVAVTPGAGLNPGRPELLFDNPALLGAVNDGYSRNYDIAPGGERFVMVQEPGPWEPRLNVVLNWSEELRTRVPPER